MMILPVRPAVAPPAKETAVTRATWKRMVLCCVGASLIVGGAALLTEAAAPCPRPGQDCPLISCPPCSRVVCDPGYCRMHCELVPGCEP